MSITRLQQARQMYALGQRVRFQGGGRDASRGDFSSPSADGGPGNKGGPVDTGDLGTEKANVQANIDANLSARDRARSQMYTNMPTPTVTVGVDKFGNPIDVKTTYTARRNRQKTLDALNKQGISSFDPRVTKNINFLDPNNLMTSFAPTKTNPFSFKNIATNIVLGIVAPQLLGPKFATGMKTYKTAQTLSKLAKDINLTDKNVLESFTGNLKSNFSDKFSDLGKGKKSTTTTSVDEDLSKIGNGDGGLESLGNMDALNQEYLLLLNKFNEGVCADEDQGRFTFVQEILGK